MKAKCIVFLLMHILIFRTQSLGSGRSVGMAGAYTAVAGGTEAVFSNPANLGFAAGSEKTLSLFSVAATVNNNSFGLGDYTQYNSHGTRKGII